MKKKWVSMITITETQKKSKYSMNRFERTLLKKIDALTKRSIKLQRDISRAKKQRLCIENIMLWIKLITVVGSLLLVLWSISTSFFNIR